MSDEPRMTGMDKEIFNATRTLTSLLNDACNHWNYLCPYLEKLAGVADDALRWYQKDYPEQVAELIDYRREHASHGDAAALREALAIARQFVLPNVYSGERRIVKRDGNEVLIGAYEALEVIDAALAAPARNVDKFTSLGDAINAWRETPPNESGCFDEWLFAPAAEKGAE